MSSPDVPERGICVTEFDRARPDLWGSSVDHGAAAFQHKADIRAARALNALPPIPRPLPLQLLDRLRLLRALCPRRGMRLDKGGKFLSQGM